MDKQRIIEIAHEIARRNEEKLGLHNQKNVHIHKMPDVHVITLIDSGITDFVAAILMEAAKVCPLSDCTTRTKLEQMAKELTE